MSSSKSHSPSALTIVALGSNLGDSKTTLHQAMGELQELSSAPLMRSSFWRTSPVDCPPGSPPFINAVIAMVPLAGETPETLLRKLQELERRHGRVSKTVLNEARPLDLDLIVFGSETRNSAELVLPHPRAHLRRFVLQPLSEIAPDLILPEQGMTVTELLAGLPADEMVTRI